MFLVLCSILVSQSAPGSNLGESEKNKFISYFIKKLSFFYFIIVICELFLNWVFERC